jgi:hypothetical protein
MWNDTGMHWRNIENRKFYRLAEQAAYDCYPEMIDAEDEHDGSIEAIFGSMGANIRLRDVTSEINAVFTHGYCGLLAWAIHQKTGLPFAVFTSVDITRGDWTGHVAIQVGEDQFLDITGVRNAASIHSEFRGLQEHVVMSADEFLLHTVAEDYRADPLSLFADLERFITEDFAEFLISNHRIKALNLVS